MTKTKFEEKVTALNLDLEIARFPESTRTAQEAANALGCEVGQIGKSLMFRTKREQTPLLCITSGADRVDEKKLTEVIGEEIEKADANFIREKTGYVIGGVPPFGYEPEIKTVIDKDLFNYENIWVAAGEVNAVFPIAPEQLREITGATVCDIKQEN